jgi:hypothetical protein
MPRESQNPDAAVAKLHEAFYGEGAFALKLRTELVWDKVAFLELITAMQNYLESARDTETLDRWIAEGFWYLNEFIKDWSTHPNFPRMFSDAYYNAAYERLHALAYWLFVGESLYQSGTLPPFNVE